MKTQITFFIAILFSLSTLAQELQTSVAPAPAATPKWKASVTSYLYDFEGTKASEKASYSFNDSTLNMQLMSLQYEYSKNWTIQVMAQHLDNYVETVLPGGLVLKDRSVGLGDTFVSAITPLYMTSEMMVLGDIGLSLPTGDINQKVSINSQQNNAYNMQNGSGTVDTVAGLTALSFQGPVQLGTHLTAIGRNGRNANGYRLGNLYRADAWVDYTTKIGVTPRLVGYYKHKEAISGQDETYRARDAYSEFYYHPQINWDLSAALKYARPVGPVTVAAEAGVPVAQDSVNHDSVVVSTQYYGNLSVSGSF